MNHESEGCKEALIERLKGLSPLDIWFPLTLDNGSVQGTLHIWDAVSLPLDDYSEIMKRHDMWIFPYGRRRRWDHVLKSWALTVAPLKAIHNEHVWVNFQGVTKKDIAPFSQGLSSCRLPSLFVQPSKRDHYGFVFHKRAIARADCDERLGCRRLEADVHAERAGSPISSAVDLHTPTSEPQLQPERPSEQAAEKRILSIFNEAALSSVLSGDSSIGYEDSKLLFNLLRKLASPIPGTNLLHIMGPSSVGNKKGQWVLLPRSAKSDAVCSSRVLRSRSRSIEFFAKEVSVGPRTIASWIKNDRSLFEKAVKLRPIKVVLSAADSAFLQAQMKFSNTNFKGLKKLLHHLNVPVGIASAGSIKLHMQKYEVESCHYANVQMEANGGSKMSCFAYIANLADVAQRDQDSLAEKGEKYVWKFSCFSEPTIVFKMGVDYGGGGDKFTIAATNSETPCSPYNVSLFASLEGDGPNTGKKPGGTYQNYKWILSRVDYLNDFHGSLILEMANSHVIFPAHVRPVVWDFEMLETGDAVRDFYAKKHGGQGGSPASRSALRSSLIQGCGKLAVLEEECLGVLAGEASFPFRKPVKVDPTKPPVIDSVSAVFLIHVNDILAQSVLLGHQGQSGHSSMWSRTSPKRFKEIARNPDLPVELRTVATEREDAAAARAKSATSKGYNAVNGVVDDPVIPIVNYQEQIVPAGLHICCLGPANLQLQLIKKDTMAFDGLPPENTAKLIACEEAVQEAECGLLDAIMESVQDLGAANPVVVSIIGSNDIGRLIESLDLDGWGPIETALEAAALAETSAAEAIRGETLNRLGHAISKRAQKAQSTKASKNESRAKKLNESSVALRKGIETTRSAREALSAEETSLRPPASEGEESPRTGGPITDAVEVALRNAGVQTQAYWTGNMVGFHCREFCRRYEEILKEIAAKVAEKHGEETADAWRVKHCSVLKHLAVISHLTRAVRILDEVEKSNLREACASYPKAFRLAHPEHATVTPKIECIERHIMRFIDLFGTLGVFGEDGLESYHPLESRARYIVRTMRSAIDRHVAMMGHVLKNQHGGNLKAKA